MLQCIYEDGKSEHRVCIFYDIVLWEGQLLYLAEGNSRHAMSTMRHMSIDDSLKPHVSAGREVLPDIDINWLEPEKLQLQVVRHDQLPQAWATAEVSNAAAARPPHPTSTDWFA